MILSPDVFAAKPSREHSSLSAADLPKGTAPQPVAIPHFSDRLQAFVWRNWTLVPVEKLASVVGAKREDIVQLGRAMGLPKPLPITRNQQRRSYITVLRRNWHLLPYEQLLTLLDWTPEEMAYVLREDDFLYVKLGNLNPQCEPLRSCSKNRSDPCGGGPSRTSDSGGTSVPVREGSFLKSDTHGSHGEGTEFTDTVLLFLLCTLRRSATRARIGSLP